MKQLVLILFVINLLEGGMTSLTLIDEAYQKGQISKTEWLELRKTSLLSPENLPDRFRGEQEPCATEILTTHWRETGGQILLTRPSLSGPEETIETTHLIIHYTQSGSDACSPTYATSVADYAEYSWSIEVDSLGWDEPPPDYGYGGDNRYDIYIIDLGSGILGYTQAEFAGPDPLQEDATSYIAIDNSIGSTGLLKVTVAHELNHACQFSYSFQEGSWWMENCAVWMEDVVYDDVNDYISYLIYSSPNPLNAPKYSITTTTNLYEYGGGIWPMFLTEFYDTLDVPRAMWERMGLNWGNHTLYDINYVLTNSYNSDLFAALQYYGLWRYFTGSRADTFHFEEASLWPSSFVLRTHNSYPASGDEGSLPLDGRGGTAFVKFNPINGTLFIDFDGQDYYHWASFVVGYREGGPQDEFLMDLDPVYATGSDTISFEDYDNIVLVPVVNHWNTYPTGLGFDYTVEAEIIAGDITIFPNPVEVFNSDTGIFYVKNDGTGDLNVSNITSITDWITGATPDSFSLLPGDSQVVVFYMDTTDLDTVNYGWLIVYSDDPDESQVLVNVTLHISPQICGDVNGDHQVDVGDITYLSNYLYAQGPPPISLWAADVNGDGSVDSGDLVYLANYLFAGGPELNCP